MGVIAGSRESWHVAMSHGRDQQKGQCYAVHGVESSTRPWCCYESSCWHNWKWWPNNVLLFTHRDTWWDWTPHCTKLATSLLSFPCVNRKRKWTSDALQWLTSNPEYSGKSPQQSQWRHLQPSLHSGRKKTWYKHDPWKKSSDTPILPFRKWFQHRYSGLNIWLDGTDTDTLQFRYTSMLQLESLLWTYPLQIKQVATWFLASQPGLLTPAFVACDTSKRQMPGWEGLGRRLHDFIKCF